MGSGTTTPEPGTARRRNTIRDREPGVSKEAAEAGIEGVVMVEGTISAKGRLISCEVSQGVHKLLDDAAAEAFRGAKCLPAVRDDKPMRSSLVIPFRFEVQ